MMHRTPSGALEVKLGLNAPSLRPCGEPSGTGVHVFDSLKLLGKLSDSRTDFTRFQAELVHFAFPFILFGTGCSLLPPRLLACLVPLPSLTRCTFKIGIGAGAPR